MDGNAPLEDLRGFLSRLTGQEQTLDGVLTLRSVHRAALASWARSRKLALRLGALPAGVPFTLRDLLSDSIAPSGAPLPAAPGPSVLAAGGTGIGIDIEDVANLPEAADYREHAFYQDNFTPAEIAHCLRQQDVRASFCGVWAAKEAILKCGLVPAPEGKLNWIQIGWDGHGRPFAAGCQLSISHTATTAVAVCIAVQAAVARPEAAASAVEIDAVPERTRHGAALVAASLLVGVIVAGLALQFSAHGVHFG